MYFLFNRNRRTFVINTSADKDANESLVITLQVKTGISGIWVQSDLGGQVESLIIKLMPIYVAAYLIGRQFIRTKRVFSFHFRVFDLSFLFADFFMASRLFGYIFNIHSMIVLFAKINTIRDESF